MARSCNPKAHKLQAHAQQPVTFKLHLPCGALWQCSCAPTCVPALVRSPRQQPPLVAPYLGARCRVAIRVLQVHNRRCIVLRSADLLGAGCRPSGEHLNITSRRRQVPHGAVSLVLLVTNRALAYVQVHQASHESSKARGERVVHTREVGGVAHCYLQLISTRIHTTVLCLRHERKGIVLYGRVISCRRVVAG